MKLIRVRQTITSDNDCLFPRHYPQDHHPVMYDVIAGDRDGITLMM